MQTTKKRTNVVVSMLALLGLALLLFPAYAGDLEPSAPPGPTMKTLNEVEPRIPISSLPYTISASGSYYVTGNLTGVTSQHGITVEVNDVTIDLMGYALIGPDPNDGTECGIYMNERSNVEIRNGTVRSFDSHGIYEASVDGKEHRVIGVRAASNGGSGIYIKGKSHLVKDCTAGENTSIGIYVRHSCTVTSNTACNNQSSGIEVGTGCTVTGNTAYNNQSDGINAGNGCTVTGNTTRSNQGKGIRVYHGCTVTGNTTYYNQNDGITAEGGCTVTGNNAYSNNQSNLDIAGISVSANCVVKGNTMSGNKDNNIYIGSDDNAIEENLVTDSNGNGIYFNFTGNFYANNRASGNTVDYAGTAGNTDGGGNVSF